MLTQDLHKAVEIMVGPSDVISSKPSMVNGLRMWQRWMAQPCFQPMALMCTSTAANHLCTGLFRGLYGPAEPAVTSNGDTTSNSNKRPECSNQLVPGFKGSTNLVQHGATTLKELSLGKPAE